MKKLITGVFLFFAMFCFSQTLEKPQLENLKIELNIDSAKELAELNTKDLKSILKDVKDGAGLQLTVNCNTSTNGKKTLSKRAKLSYKINGNKSSEKEFLAMTKRIKKAVTKYYKNERKG